MMNISAAELIFYAFQKESSIMECTVFLESFNFIVLTWQLADPTFSVWKSCVRLSIFSWEWNRSMNVQHAGKQPLAMPNSFF